MKKTALWLALALGTLGGVTACGQPEEDAGDQMEEAAEDMGGAMEEAADEMGDAVEEAGEAAEDAADEATEPN